MQVELIPELLAKQASHQPNATFLQSWDPSTNEITLLSYGELELAVWLSRAELGSLGVSLATRVALLSRADQAFFVSVLAVMTSGGTCVNLMWNTEPNALALLLDTSRATYLLASREFADAIPVLRRVCRCLWMDEVAGDDRVDMAARQPAHPGLTPDDLALIMFTSGTTSEPVITPSHAISPPPHPTSPTRPAPEIPPRVQTHNTLLHKQPVHACR